MYHHPSPPPTQSYTYQYGYRCTTTHHPPPLAHQYGYREIWVCLRRRDTSKETKAHREGLMNGRRQLPKNGGRRGRQSGMQRSTNKLNESEQGRRMTVCTTSKELGAKFSSIWPNKSIFLSLSLLPASSVSLQLVQTLTRNLSTLQFPHQFSLKMGAQLTRTFSYKIHLPIWENQDNSGRNSGKNP